MQRNIKRTITVVMVLISVLLLLSPIVFAKVFVKIDDVGLKSLHIRADILEEGSPGKHGRISAMIREMTEEVYSYKFMIDLKKATPNTQYIIWLYADLPEEVVITIYGDGTGLWPGIEWVANSYGIDYNEESGVIETTVGDLLSVLGFTEGTIELNTGMTFTTDDRGNFKSIKEGIITEDDAMEHALDLAWPTLRQYLSSLIPGIVPPDEIDFADLGITGLWVHGGQYSISGYVKFVGGDPEDPVDVYVTETVTIDRVWNDLIWDRGV